MMALIVFAVIGVVALTLALASAEEGPRDVSRLDEMDGVE